MCGRFAAFWDDQAIGYRLDADLVSGLPGPSWNIAPTQTVAVVVQGRDDTRRLAPAYWSLIPPDAPDMHLDFPTFNARSETALERPTFRAAAQGFRSIFPVSGYYEWDGRHRPWYFTASDDANNSGGGTRCAGEKDGVNDDGGTAGTPGTSGRQDKNSVLWLAGLCSWWRDPATGQWRLTSTILTRDAVGRAAQVHDRMPVIVPNGLVDPWLDRAVPGERILPDVHRAAGEQAGALASHEVAPLHGDSPHLLDPAQPTLW